VLLAIHQLCTDGGTQTRAVLDQTIVNDYAEAMTSGDQFPPIVAYYDGRDYWLADGFHRVNAALKAGRDTIEADIRQGTRRDAILYSVGANAVHGLRRTNADKRRGVITLLEDAEWKQWSDREIARRVGVSQPFVGSIRAELSPPTDNGYQSDSYRKGADGRVTNTANIGKPAYVKPALPDDMPPDLREWVDLGIIGVTDAIALRDELSDAESIVVRIVVTYRVTSIETVRVLKSLKANSDTLQEIANSGFIQPGDEAEAVSVTAGALALKAALGKKAESHKLLALDERQTLALLSSESNEWYTPSVYIEAARTVMGGFTLDPASCAKANAVIRAEKFYTLEDDGLRQAWCGTVWLNPPYGRSDSGDSNQALWSARLIRAWEQREIEAGILLVNAVTAEQWFQPLWAYPICFTNHRIKFYNASGEQSQPTHGNAFIYFGNEPGTFAKHFKQFGAVVLQVERGGA
jgi:hypothetical protein